MKAFVSSLAIFTVLISSGAAQAALIDRGSGLIYDSDLNVTWLQDANYAKTSGYAAEGLMTWSQAMTWASNLTYGGYTDWRLPTTLPVNGTSLNYNWSLNGSTDYGYNISAQGTTYAGGTGGTGSEMARLFYNSLNNKGLCDPLTATVDYCSASDVWGLANKGPFTNFPSGAPLYYWSGTEFGLGVYSGYAFDFDLAQGGQGGLNEDNSFVYALAVRSGDVAAVPTPAAAWLLGSGLLGLIGVARRKAA